MQVQMLTQQITMVLLPCTWLHKKGFLTLWKYDSDDSEALCTDSLSFSIVQALLAAGANLHMRTGDGYTPLHTAAEHNSREVVQVIR